MDPVTLAIVAAVTAGVTGGAGKVVEKTVLDAYEGLKGLLKKKFGKEGSVTKAVAYLEEEPDFKPYQEGLKQRIEGANAHKDPETLEAAQALLELLQDKPAGAQAIHNIQNVYGDYSAAAGPYGTATVNVSQPHKKK